MSWASWICVWSVTFIASLYVGYRQGYRDERKRLIALEAEKIK